MGKTHGLLLSLILVISSTTLSYSAYLDLAWHPNSEADLAGYRVYYGTSSGNYGTPIDVGNVTAYRLSGLNDGVRYYVAITAYDTANNESAKSLETNAIPPDTQNPAITITSPTSSANYATSHSAISIGGSASDNVSVTQITWVNSRGGSGTASGSSSWSVANIALQVGNNIITVTAQDAAHNSGTDSITISYTPLTTSSSTSVAPSTSTTTSVTTTQPSSSSSSSSTTVPPSSSTTTSVTTTQPSSSSTSTAQPTTTTTAGQGTTTSLPATTSIPSSTSTVPSVTTTTSTQPPLTTTSSIPAVSSCDEPQRLMPLSVGASSEFPPRFAKDNLIDGDPRTSWSTVLSLFRHDASITLDLGGLRYITSLSMYASRMFGIDFLPANIQLWASTDNSTFEPISAGAGYSSLQPPYADSWIINAHPCRYLKLVISARKGFFLFQLAQIAELEVYGCSPGGTPFAQGADTGSTNHEPESKTTSAPSGSPYHMAEPGLPTTPGRPAIHFSRSYRGDSLQSSPDEGEMAP